MADVVVGAVGGVESVAVFGQCFELDLQGGEVPHSCADVRELGFQERGDVPAGHAPLVAKVDDAADLGEGEPGGLRHGDEAQAGQQCLVVDAVAVGAAFGVGRS